MCANSPEVTAVNGADKIQTVISKRARGLGGPKLGQSHYFSGKSSFFWAEPATKNEKIYFFKIIKRKNGIHSV